MSSSSTPSDSNQSGQTPKQPAKHDEMAVKSILARAAAAKTPEYPPLHQTYPSSMTGGVLPMVLVGRFSHERERLGPDFTDAERQWRIKWYKDQHLHPKEPFTVPLLEKEMRNPLRRFYKIPLNYLEHQILAPRFGKDRAWLTRQLIGKFSLAYGAFLCFWYTLKYNQHTWEYYYGPKVQSSRTEILPNRPEYPAKNIRPNHEDYADFGFKARKVFLNP